MSCSPRHAVDHAARTEEEEPLEECVRHQVEDAARVSADTHRQEHVAELADGRVGEHLLDVVLDEADGRGEDGGRRANRGHDVERGRRHRIEEAHPRDHVDAGRHHGGGVDQRRNRRRAGHGVGQPHVERNLRRLAGGADEQEQRRHRRDRRRDQLGVRAKLGELQRPRAPSADRPEEQHEAEQEAGVTDAVDDEGLLPGIGVFVLLVPEADQEIGTEPDTLPADEKEQD